MAELKPRPTALQLDNLEAGVFLDPRFKAALKEKLPNLHAEILGFVQHKGKGAETDEDEEYKHAVLGHLRHSHYKAKTFTIDSDDPVILEGVMKAIEEFLSEEKK